MQTGGGHWAVRGGQQRRKVRTAQGQRTEKTPRTGKLEDREARGQRTVETVISEDSG